MIRETGSLISLKDGIGDISGLAQVSFGELVQSGKNVGIVLNLSHQTISVAFFTSIKLRANDIVFRQRSLPSVYIATDLLGNVLNPLGNLDSDLSLTQGTYMLIRPILSPSLPIEIKAPGIIFRQSVYETLATGVRIIDSLIPIGLGQRELIIGDRKTGKTALVLDMIINTLRIPKFFFNS